mgnify:CR=1 FL=1
MRALAPLTCRYISGGGAFGKNVRAECEMARNWGLVPVTYEGGWAVQADFDDYGMLA